MAFVAHARSLADPCGIVCKWHVARRPHASLPEPDIVRPAVVGLVASVAAVASQSSRRKPRRRTVFRQASCSSSFIEAFRGFKSGDGQDFELDPTAVLGAGAQGTVYRGTAVRTGQAVAVKVIETWRWILDRDGADKIASIDIEFKARRALGMHPNIVGMIAGADIFRDFMMERAGPPLPHYKFMVMELVEGCELAQHLAESGPLPECIARHVLTQILCGLAHIHGHGVVHRDLKPENVLVTGDTITLDSRIKIVDFGTAKLMDDGPPQTVVGTASVMAPEVIQRKLAGARETPRTEFTWAWSDAAGTSMVQSASEEPLLKQFGPEIDLWALGIILFVCLVGKLPFGSEADVVHTALPEDLLGHCSADARHLVARLLEKDPQQRLSLRETQQHPWMTACFETAE